MHSQNPILVSVCCTTYNHEQFIKKCLEGFVMQQTNFSFEVLVHEDASTDNTAIIIKEYESKYPNLFRCVYQTENQFLKQNTLINILFPMVKGKYIAMCEGDDYWTDPNKLQKQVDFLEANPEYAICFHAVNILDEGKLRPAERNPSNKEETYSIIDLAKSNFFYTPSVIYRNDVIQKLPDWFGKAPAGDYVLHLLHAKKGLIKYFPDVMAVYRGHAGGIWSQKDSNYKFEIWLNLLELLLKEDFDFPVLQVLTQQKNKTLNELIESLLRENAYDKIKQTIYKFCEGSVSTDILPITDMLIGRINDLENHVAGVKSTRTYKIAKKISALKQNIYK